ncbi:hypothetical protein [Geomonas subterranea]|uniref:Coiled coil domain-containing protein n=1 Tax=Geomonas subterranea TaxID=2847989 RepID=A0ABX8LQD8_9BACT|nr:MULTISPECIES: hypothetical protein [Geomonas]QXE92453.1 hypothetical protein KP001_07995 [Geomonas subterranea]QXM09448.1 hypothetical protein KP002_21275 [Geomonas subterranea]
MDEQRKYVEKLSAQMVEWDNQIDRLKDKAASATADSKSDYHQAIEALQRKRHEASERLQRVAVASDDEWEDLKVGTEQVLGEVRSILRDAVMKIK